MTSPTASELLMVAVGSDVECWTMIFDDGFYDLRKRQASRLMQIMIIERQRHTKKIDMCGPDFVMSTIAARCGLEFTASLLWL